MTDKNTKIDWQERASKEIRGRDLVWRTPEGIEVQPLYTAQDAEGLDPGLPGFAPYTAQSARSCDFGHVEEQRLNMAIYQARSCPPIS